MAVKVNDAERHHDWNVERFSELGFSEVEANFLDYVGVDWHEMKALLEQGCSLEDAMEILA